MRRIMQLIVIGAAVYTAGSTALAATLEEFTNAFAAATTSVNEAAAVKNQWTTTTQALADSKKAADAKNFDEAVSLAKQAEALARASLFQARAESGAWKDAEIK
ncbi:MAG: hypothetical protein JWM36_3074 [Hyphomicrobiales bacterium]|jgi:hypothetical protein|nr:hypothetical protein [Hyphomicrobiales bacterium]